MAGKLEGFYIDKLRSLASDLGFEIAEKRKYADGHYIPDLVWEKSGKRIGFEVEYGKVNNKKKIGDAFWLCRTFDIAFILVKGKG